MTVVAGLLVVAIVATVWFFLNYIKGQNVQHEARVSELLTRIQHPEIVRPDIPARRAEVPPTEPEDEMHLIGTIQGGTMNGNNAET